MSERTGSYPELQEQELWPQHSRFQQWLWLTCMQWSWEGSGHQVRGLMLLLSHFFFLKLSDSSLRPVNLFVEGRFAGPPFVHTCSHPSGTLLGREIPALKILSNPKHDDVCVLKPLPIIICLSPKESRRWGFLVVPWLFAIKQLQLLSCIDFFPLLIPHIHSP